MKSRHEIFRCMITEEHYGRYHCDGRNKLSLIRQFPWCIMYCTKITDIFCVVVMIASKLKQAVSLHFKGTELDRNIGQIWTQHVWKVLDKLFVWTYWWIWFSKFLGCKFWIAFSFFTSGQLPSSRHLALILIDNFTGAEILKFFSQVPVLSNSKSTCCSYKFFLDL